MTGIRTEPQQRAEVELDHHVLLRRVLERLPDFELAGEPTFFEDAGTVYAARELPVKFTPGARIGNAK